MNTSDGYGLSRKEIGYPFNDRVGDMAIGTGKQTGDDIPVLLCFHLEGKLALTCWTAKDFYDFFFHGVIPYLVIP